MIEDQKNKDSNNYWNRKPK